jgi:hypothetical protein
MEKNTKLKTNKKRPEEWLLDRVEIKSHPEWAKEPARVGSKGGGVKTRETGRTRLVFEGSGSKRGVVQL